MMPGFVLAADNAPGTVTPTDTANGTTFVPLTQFPQITSLAQSNGFGDFVNTLYKICIGAGAVLAVIMIMVAGVQFMTSRGSVSSNEKAKSRIQNAILGLILVLAPTIVFGIINPSILNLNLGTEFSGLKQDHSVDQNAFASPTTDSPIPSTCSDYTVPQALPEGQTCATQSGGSYVQIAAACCSIKDPSSHATCCGLPKTSAQASGQYMWKVTVTPTQTQNLTGNGFTQQPPTTKQGGPFSTQKACQDSYSAYQTVANSGGKTTVQCDCSKTRDQFQACKQ